MNDGESFSNEFGAVYPDRIVVNSKKSWFGGGSREDLPIRHVTSVKLETNRRVVGGVICLLIALIALYTGTAAGIVLGILFGIAGVLFLIGWPKVSVNTSGNDLQIMTGTFLQRDAAEQYVAAVKKALFARP